MSILHSTFNTKYNTVPFSDIKTDEFLPAFKHLIDSTKSEIQDIVNASEAPTFENTIEALDYSGEQLDRVSSMFFNLNSAETNDVIQKIAQDVSPLLSEFKNDIILNQGLFERVKAVYDMKDALDLTTEQLNMIKTIMD